MIDPEKEKVEKMVSHLNPCFCTLKFTNSTNRLRLLLKRRKDELHRADLVIDRPR
jgi:Zn-dependent M16 (insulinase) family peptidase